MQLCASDNELAALMRQLARVGYRTGKDELSPAECMEICEFVTQESLGLQRSLDMRLLFNAYSDYLSWRECESGCGWQDMVAARLRERPTSVGQVRSVEERQSQHERELALAAQLFANVEDRAERAAQWTAQTGLSEQTLYRRWTQARSANNTGEN